MSTKEREAFTPWPQLVRGFEQEAKKPSGKLTPRELALYGIYTAIPPRRVRDYQLLRLAGPDTDLTPDANWLVLNAAGKPVRMELSNYKTSARYGKFVRDSIPPALAKVLQAYIEDEELEARDVVFGTQEGEPYSPGAFSTMIGKLFQKLTGKRASVLMLRHAAIVHFLRTQRTVKE